MYHLTPRYTLIYSIVQSDSIVVILEIPLETVNGDLIGGGVERVEGI
jgi:hypothetical protein